MSPASPTRLTLVVGTGRSGTSTAAGVLRRLGLHVPTPEVSTDSTNPKGFGEPRWAVDFHDELLARAGVEVSDARPEAWARTDELGRDPAVVARLRDWLAAELAGADHLLVKDPRLLWFVPLWTATARDLGAEPAYVTLLRPPAEVVGSKRASYNRGLDDTHGVAAWVNLMLGTERATRDAPRILVRYHDLLDDPAAATRRLATGLDLQATPAPVDEISAYVDPGLRRIRLTWDDLDLPDHVERVARRAWTLLGDLADEPPGSPGAPAALTDLDLMRADYEQLYRCSEAVARSSVRAARRDRTPAPAPDALSVRAAGRQLLGALRRRAGRGRVRRSVVTGSTAPHTRGFTPAP